MKTRVDIDWTNVVNFDDHGSVWGESSVTEAEDLVERAQTDGYRVDEWYTRDRDGLRHRIVRIADPEFLDTICVFPEECDDCGAPVTSLARVSDEHHAKCPRRDPNF
ncbi:hypothetical protein ACIPXV_09785 [Streptomyces libani]|uniref:hypothetical protein n=1 Tax=Streptomyces nigrescens TaxID=1920 RepID=UPI0037F59028